MPQLSFIFGIGFAGLVTLLRIVLFFWRGW
jgi:hypothetical protein